MVEYPSLSAIYRIVDASANRATEGLRTLEEYARFALDDRFLTETTKTIRHELHGALAAIPMAERLKARSVASDCGTEIVGEQEMQRADLLDVVAAAASRTQQAMRCLEEYLKPVSAAAAGSVESLRYRTYSLAAALLLLKQKCERLAQARLYLLIEADQDAERFVERVERFFAAGVDIIQLRDKGADDVMLYKLSRRAAAIARAQGKLFIVNDRADIAAASGAQGVHVGQDELPVEAVRRIVGTNAIIGVSTHSVGQVGAAVNDGADYVGCGPTFPSQTKGFKHYPGTAFLQAVRGETGLPAYAIGGIDVSNLDAVLATGIHGVAVSHAIVGADDPLAAVAMFRQRLDRT
jgi:thiamine-phosphate pyrophosphorylase